MSLVAYGSSGDESEGDEQEQQAEESLGPRQQSQRSVEGRRGSDDEFDIVGGNSSIEHSQGEKPLKGIFSFLPPPTKETKDLIIEEDNDIQMRKITKGNDFQSERKNANLNADTQEYSGTDKMQSTSGKLSKLSLPKPKRTEGDDRQKVKIAIPSLPDDDSDSDEERTKKKYIKPTGKKGSSLLCCLPQPKFGSSVGKSPIIKLDQRKPQRLYVPYTLSKKKEETKTNINKTKIVDEPNSDSDEEGSSQSFFSFAEKVSDVATVESQSQIGVKDSGEQLKEKLSRISSKNTSLAMDSSNTLNHIRTSTTSDAVMERLSKASSYEKKKTMYKDYSQAKTLQSTGVESNPKSMTNAFAPMLSSNKNEEIVTGPYIPMTGSRDVAYDLSSVIGPYSTEASFYGSYAGFSNHNAGPAASHDYVTGPYGTGSDSQPSIMGYGTANMNVGNDPSQHGKRSYLNPQPNQFDYHGGYEQANVAERTEGIDADQLRRLQGKRERRVQEVDIIDIQGEMMHCDQATLLKNVTEETAYQAKKPKNDNLPSGQQKRKHQITYLAFQAKEREAELRKNWAANHQTKRQTQQKYGF